MRIRCSSWEHAEQVVAVLQSFLSRSRFNLNGRSSFGNHGGGLEIRRVGRRFYVMVNGVRLNTTKGYCGNHAGPCIFGRGKKHKRLAFLEGLDWVSFNDMLNDALDSIHHDGNVESTTCIIRKGKCRRTQYLGVDGGEFDKDTHAFFNYCGQQAPRSDYHQGTPGIIGWGADCIEAPYEEEVSV